jgi:hypothetical protein
MSTGGSQMDMCGVAEVAWWMLREKVDRPCGVFEPKLMIRR